jgi:hypothetical protein
MIPMIISGVFVAGLVLVHKLCEPSEPWNNREEQQRFQNDRERWAHGGWMLYR